jgi:hypothetical protein
MYRVTIKEIDTFNVIKTVSVVDTVCVVAYRKDENLFPGIPSWQKHHVSTLDTTTAVASVDGMLRSVWTELDYHTDICRVTKGPHIEHS